MPKPNLLIAGTGRAGSTSIFRYLSDHPDVCASSKKETMFFIDYQDSAGKMLSKYSEYFSHCKNNQKIIMEATPHYLHNGHKIAKTIKMILPDVKLIFIFRDPVERFFTAFRNEKNIGNKIFSDLDFDEFSDIAINGARQSDESVLSEIEKLGAYYLDTGNYANHLRHYLDYFPDNQILFLFFDDLKKDTSAVMMTIARFLGIDSSYYKSYNFSIENKTRTYRYSRFHRFAYLTNQFLEAYLNRISVIRKMVRRIYLGFNERKAQAPVIPDITRKKLIEYYAPQNDNLHKLLGAGEYSGIFPEWIRSEPVDHKQTSS